MYRYFGLLLLLLSCSYLPDKNSELPEDVNIEETSDHIALIPVDSTRGDAILFVPGGLIDPHAYRSLLMPLCLHNNMLVVIPKVRGNLAILNPRSLDHVRESFEGYRWILGGHSLGGTVATMAAHDHPERWTALFLLGAYSTVDLLGFDGPVLSLRGSQDELATYGDWQKHKENLPQGIYINALSDMPTSSTIGHTLYYTVEGGNHAQWGSYGTQKKDGAASISREEQQQIFYTVLTQTLRLNGYNI